MEAVKNDMLMVFITEVMIFNKAKWKKIIHIADLKKIRALLRTWTSPRTQS